jgi:hypothetical protein
VAVLLLLGVPITAVIGKAGTTTPGHWMQPRVHVITITKPVTSIDVQSYGSDIRVIGGGTSRVQVAETVSYDTGGPEPTVTDEVSGGRLTLAAPDCAEQDCSVGFTLRVPATVSVTAVASGGNIVVSGVTGASLDSGGGNVTASSVSGTLTVTSEGGNQYLAGIDGTLAAESGGGDLVVQGLTAPAATITTDGGNLTATGMTVPSATLSSGGGNAQAGFAAPPSSLIVTTDGGNAALVVPGGPYALTADSSGGPEVVGIAISPAARATLNVNSGGGSLVIQPGTGSPAAGPARSLAARDRPAVPAVPRVPRAPRVPRSAP